MAGIPNELYKHCRSVLSKCNEFKSDENLRSLFVTEKLKPFENGLPEATSQSDRIDRNLAYFINNQSSKGESLLCIVLEALRDRYPQENALHDELQECWEKVQPHFKNTETTTTSDRSTKTSKIDFLIVTALEEERDAVLAKLPDVHKLPPSQEDIRIYYSSELPVTFSDNSIGNYQIIVMSLLGMGRVQASTSTSDAIQQWKPRYVMLVGIAGGVASRDVNLGDILISNQIVDYELQKITTEGQQIRWEVHRADPRLLEAAKNFTDNSYTNKITANRPIEGFSKRHIAPIASGDKVIACGEILEKYREIWSKIVGVEMEAAGAATASFQSANPPGFFMVRGVSDLADKNKGSEEVEQWRSYACDIAASYAIALLQSGAVPLQNQ